MRNARVHLEQAVQKHRHCRNVLDQLRSHPVAKPMDQPGSDLSGAPHERLFEQIGGPGSRLDHGHVPIRLRKHQPARKVSAHHRDPEGNDGTGLRGVEVKTGDDARVWRGNGPAQPGSSLFVCRGASGVPLFLEEDRSHCTRRRAARSPGVGQLDPWGRRRAASHVMEFL